LTINDSGFSSVDIELSCRRHHRHHLAADPAQLLLLMALAA